MGDALLVSVWFSFLAIFLFSLPVALWHFVNLELGRIELMMIGLRQLTSRISRLETCHGSFMFGRKRMNVLMAASCRKVIAFTLIELLVVIAIIGILAAFLLPALSSSKKRAESVYCMNNSRQLALAMQLYVDDSGDFYPPNPDDANTMDGYNWCCGDVSGGIGGQSPGGETFNSTILKNPKKSLLIPYAKNATIFQCPADPRMGPASGDPGIAGKYVKAARSISMNQGVGTIDPAFDAYAFADNHQGTPSLSVNGPWLDGEHNHKRNSPFATFGKASDFSIASPSQVFLMVDESPWKINDAAFGVSAGRPLIVDWPSTTHNNACGFSFCDGHAEIHKWQTMTFMSGERVPGSKEVTPDNPDWLWLKDHSTVKLREVTNN